MKKMIVFFLLLALPIYAYHEFSSQFHVRNTQEILDYVKELIVDNPVIIECGAWNGDDTIQLSETWPKGKIYAFEPIKEHFLNVLKRTASNPNIALYPVALADVNGELKFHLSDFQNNGVLGGSSSLLPPKEHFKFDHVVTFNKVITVPATTLDDWAKKENVNHIDFMWLDMQGFELNMLMNSQMLKKTKLIYMEVEFIEAYEKQYLYPEIKKWMERNGFMLIGLDFDEKIGMAGASVIKPGNGHPYYGNVLFLNREMIKNVQ